MRLREFSTPKSASKDAIEAETIKRQQQKPADRDAQLKVKNTEQQLAKQSQKPRALNNTGNPSPKIPAH
jgi:hypothetical protein